MCGSAVVMLRERIADAIAAVDAWERGLWRFMMTPQGEVFDNSLARELASRAPGLMLIAGRYEGIDERVRSLVDQEISVGDYVLSGGEIPAMTIIEAVGRMIPGVLGNPESLDEESFAAGMLEYPQYTRPEEFREMRVPETLLSGDHAKIREWRAAESKRRTARRRPDLVA